MTWILGLGTLALLIFLFGYFLLSLIMIIPTWRICVRAGFSGALSLFHLLPVVGQVLILAVLAFADWPNGEDRTHLR